MHAIGKCGKFQKNLKRNPYVLFCFIFLPFDIKYYVYFFIIMQCSLSLSRQPATISLYHACVCALVYFSLFLRFSIDLCLSFPVKLAGSEDNAESKKLAKKNYDWKFRVFTM